MFEVELPKKYWTKAVATAVYLLNRSPNFSIKHKMLEELYTGEKQDLSHLRILGCRFFCTHTQEGKKKVGFKGKKYIFVGYCEDSKGYRLIDPEINKITKSWNVIFLEDNKVDNTQSSNFIQFQTFEADEENSNEDDGNNLKTTENPKEDTETFSNYYAVSQKRVARTNSCTAS